MKVHVKGKGSVDIAKNDFVAGGGQGDVYAVGRTAYKLYHDASRMLPVGKIAELQALTQPNIVKPTDILVDDKGVAIGYTMPFVTDAEPLAKIFTKAFRDRSGLTPKQINSLVLSLRGTVQHVHDANILIVDLNELNFLVTNDFSKLYAIDVDSYQTPSYRATAIMDSIRDRQAKPGAFTEGTDWFSFAVISFMMFVGIHPFKGKHPQFKGAAIDAMDARMKAGISVLNKDVAVPGATMPFNLIPQVWLNWYEQVFHNHVRVAPPQSLIDAVTIITRVAAKTGTTLIKISDIFTADVSISSIYENGTNWATVAGNTIYVQGRPCGELPEGKMHNVAFTAKRDTALVTYVKDGLLCAWDPIMKKGYTSQIPVTEVMGSHGRIFVRHGGTISTVNFTETAMDTIISASPIANVMPKATSMFAGCAVQNMLGSSFWSLFPTKGGHYQIRLKELEGRKIIDAKYDNGVLFTVSVKNGDYERHIFRFDSMHMGYDCRVEADGRDIEFITLESGVVIHLIEDGKLNLFSSKVGDGKIRQVEDKGITSSMSLCHHKGRLAAYEGAKLITLSMN